MLRNLVRFHQHGQQLSRLFSSSVNYADTMPNYIKQRERLLIELLKGHDFNAKQQNSICEFVKENQIQLTDQDLFKIDNSVKFWKQFIVEKPRLSENQEELIDHLHVLSITEPSLLFIDSVEMKKRVNLVQHSGFCDSKSDVANLFIKAPRGREGRRILFFCFNLIACLALFLQQWPDVILKAYYLHNRVVDWILNKKPCNLYPHPIVKYPTVLAKPYDEIKTRYLFAVRSGYKSKALYQELTKSTPYDTFRDLMVISMDRYMETVAKGLTQEEFLVYKEMLRLQDQEEDQMFKDLSLMSNSIASESVVQC